MNHLEKENFLKTNDKEEADISETKCLFPMEPLKIMGGTKSRKSESADFRKSQSKACYNVVQELST